MFCFQIEQDILNKQGEKEYAGILGYPAFHKAAAEFALTKEERVIKENLVSEKNDLKTVLL